MVVPWRGLVLGSLLLAMLVGGTIAGAQEETPLPEDAQWLLFVTQDESSMEQRISDYLRKRGVVVNVVGESSDIAVRTSYGIDDDYSVQIHIDTWRSNTTDDGTVVERIIILTGVVIAPPALQVKQHLPAYLAHVNAWIADRFSPGRLVIDQDGDFLLKSTINVPGPNTPIHAEMVYDQVVRTVDAAVAFVDSLEAVDLGGDAEQDAGADAPGGN